MQFHFARINRFDIDRIPSDGVCITTINCNHEKSDNVEKASAVWTYNATLTLLKLYENKLEMLETPKKKTRIWNAISESLKDYNIEMTPDQVRWKINALTKKYKQCVDTGHCMKFKYFKEMDNIYAQYNVDCDSFTIGEFLHKKKDGKQPYTKDTSIKTNVESKAMIELRKIRLANRIESERSQSKNNLEKQWLEYLKRQEQNKLLQDQIFERNLKLKEEDLQLRRQEIEMKESIEIRKLQLKEQEQDDLLLIEREKCEMLKQIFADRIIL
ncbi:uncharacterized protein LOC126770065 isoform X2 [Nymphalis io]|uniref:uncharacterized protein LOC126770065 isoform X2 n=1 Tax=Inachis io TaxID=171585 RepID=UPI0021682804|nr:uncharacterized protein LOC126770065 isoform X2 [Nymphalis io]